MIMRTGRPRRYALRPLEDFRSIEVARAAARLVELSERVLDQIEDLSKEALNQVPREIGFSIGVLALHLGWAELRWIERLADSPAPDALNTVFEPGALAALSSPPIETGPADAFRPAYERLRTEWTLPILRAILDPRAAKESKGLRIDPIGVMDHLSWHWTYHSGHIGLLRMLAGYDYAWTFGKEVSSS